MQSAICPPQLIPAGTLVTVPVPVPTLATVKTGLRLKVAVTVALAVKARIQGPVPLQPSLAVDVSSLRVAWFIEFPGAEPTAAVREAVHGAVTALHDAGARVSEATPPRLEEALPLTVKYWRRPESSSWSSWEPGFASRLTADEVEEDITKGRTANQQVDSDSCAL